MPKQNLENFLQQVPGRTTDPFDIDNIIEPSGDLRKLEGIDVVIKNLNRIFLIPKGTYIFDPTFGTGLYKYIFEPSDIITKTSIEQEISNIILKYEDRTDITFKVLFFSNKKGFRIDFQIDYRGRKREISVNIDENLLKTLPK